jgi:hypothetical protein
MLVIGNKRIELEYFVKLDDTIGYKIIFNLLYIFVQVTSKVELFIITSLL